MNGPRYVTQAELETALRKLRLSISGAGISTLPPPSEGVEEFIELSDTPDVYAGYAGSVPTVNAGEDALEWNPYVNLSPTLPLITIGNATDDAVDVAFQLNAGATPVGKWRFGLDVTDANKFKLASGDEFGNSHDVLQVAAYDGSTAGVSEFTVVTTFTDAYGNRGGCTDGLYLYYADNFNKQIVKIDIVTGVEITRSAAITGGDLRKMAYGNGYVYIVNQDSTRIRKYDTDLTYIGQTDAFSATITGLCYWGGFLYVCNQTDHDVHKVRCSDLTVIWTAAFAQGDGDDEFDLAKGITTDGDYLYVLDYRAGYNNRIVRLDIEDGAWVDATVVATTFDALSYAIWIAGDWLYVATDHGTNDVYAEKYLRADMTLAESFAIASDAVYQGFQYGDYHYLFSNDPAKIYKYWFTSSASYAGSGFTFRLPDEYGQVRDLMKLTAAGNLGIGTISPDEKLEAVGNIQATLGQFISTVPTGTMPFNNVSTTLCTNLNAGLVDGYHHDQSLLTTAGPTFDHLHLTTDLPVSEGGTGKSSFTLYAIPYASGTTTIGEIAIGAAGKVLAVNGTEDGYEWIAAGGGGAFTDLTDVPANYAGAGGYVVKVNATADGLEFVAGGAGVASFNDLDDVPASYVDQAGLFVRVNATEDGLEYAAGGSGAPTDATYITQTANGDLSAEQALGSLATGILKNTTTTGVLSIAAPAQEYSKHCWIHETFDGLATGGIIGLGSYFEAGAWADDTLAAGSTAEVTVKAGADKMLTITNKAAAGITTSGISSHLTTAIGCSGGARLHFKFKINQDAAGYYGNVDITDTADTQMLRIYMRNSTGWKISFNNGTTTTNLQAAAKDTWYTVDVIWGSHASNSATIFIDGAYSAKLAVGNAATKWDRIWTGCTSPAGGSDCVLDVDDLYFYSLFPLGLD